LGRLNKDILKRFADMILNDPIFSKKIVGIRVKFLLVAIAHLLAIYGAKSFHDTKQSRYERQGLGAEYQKAVEVSKKEIPHFFK